MLRSFLSRATARPLPGVSGRCRGVAVAAGVVLLGAAAAPAVAASPSEGDTTVVLTLAAGSPDLLAAAAQGRLAAGGSVATRLSALAAARPATATRETVASRLRAAGLRVTGGDAWSVQASGSAGAVASVFGALPRAGAALPLPSAYAGQVLSATVTGGAPLWRHASGPARPAASHAGETPPPTDPLGEFRGYLPSDLRSAYAAPAAGNGTGATVGVVSFSGWTPADAVAYAERVGIGLADGQITTVPIRPLSTADAQRPDGNGGDFEVALDVEAALAAAPAAAQRVYVGDNSAAGALNVYATMAADAEAGRLTAVTTSWGTCEQAIDESVSRSIEQSIARIVAAGATVLAASGDDGAYDCGDGRTVSVDFPASSDTVLAVGGTRLEGRPGSWVETGWSPGSDGSISASGGGLSRRTPRPAWQTNIDLPGNTRMVPDVSALADASRGLLVYGDGGGGRGWYLAGGTSLAAPVQAGMLATTMSALGRSRGPGLLQPLLYATAAAQPLSVRDVTSGSNGVYDAAPGYDLVTGLGSPQWTAIADALERPGAGPVVRFAGANRYETATGVFTATFGCAVTEGQGRRDALLATGASFPDALAGNALAGALGTGTLLTAPDVLPPTTLAGLRRAGVQTVHLLGGTSAVSDAVAEALRATETLDCQGNPTGRTFTVERIGGANRYDTARQLSERAAAAGVGTVALDGGVARPTAILATGAGFADALAAGPLAYRGTAGPNGNGKPFPTLLTEARALSPEAAQGLSALGVTQVIVPGGTAAVSEAIEAQLRAAGIEVLRLAGPDRTATAAALAAFAARSDGLGFDATTVALARGDAFADALTGGPASGASAHPVLLTADPQALGTPTARQLTAFRGRVTDLRVLGGSAAVADATVRSARDAAGL